MDALGLTFDELLQRLQPSAAATRKLRAAYRDLFSGVVPDDSSLAADVLPIAQQSSDGELVKFTQRTPDDLEIESVVVPMERSGRRWKTLCVSSQIGCGRGCAFCETAQLGLLRNLTAGEIVGQFVAARRHFGEIRNVVFMGMGEPFDNFDAVTQAIRVLNDRRGASLGRERIKVSTVGRVEGIRRFGRLGWRRITLAISLNAPNDRIRSQIMPINRLDPMPRLRSTLLEYPGADRRWFMIEYVLLPGVNDATDHARELADYLRPLRSVVNVIPYNPRRESPWRSPTTAEIRRFTTALADAGQVCKLRVTKGLARMAACGQLGNRSLSRPPAVHPGYEAGGTKGRTSYLRLAT